jgi:hypothetical protein
MQIHDCRVTIVYGEPGSGKTSLVQAVWQDQLYVTHNPMLPGYAGQAVVLLDDWSQIGRMDILHHLLQPAEARPEYLRNCTRLIITCNDPVQDGRLTRCAQATGGVFQLERGANAAYRQVVQQAVA